jgi:hypothetical protein
MPSVCLPPCPASLPFLPLPAPLQVAKDFSRNKYFDTSEAQEYGLIDQVGGCRGVCGWGRLGRVGATAAGSGDR